MRGATTFALWSLTGSGEPSATPASTELDSTCSSATSWSSTTRGFFPLASSADESAEHHNPPGSLPHTIVVNSVNKYGSLTSSPPSYLQFNGCTNFGTKITVSVPSSSCSSEATGKSAGVAGLIYSAAINAISAGRLRPARYCLRVRRIG